MAVAVQAETFETIWEEWERILPDCVANTIFVTPWWQKVWWNNFGHGNKLWIHSVREGDSVLGVAPLMERAGVVTFVGDKDLSDYFDFLAIEGNEEDFYRALCSHLADSDIDWRCLDLPSLREDSPTLNYLPALAEERGLKVQIERETTTPVAQLPNTWDEYVAGLRRKDRHELRRKLRRLEGTDGHHQYQCSNGDGLGDCMDDFFRLLRASKEEKAEFLTPGRERFFVDIAEELSSRDQFKLYFLEVSGERVACCICLDYGGSYLLYNSGYDPGYSQLSVGLLNKAFSIRTAIEEGRRSFNFLKGNERYKYHLGGQDVSVYRLTALR